ncbi:MAG TPA: hypothetical protein VEK82_16340, partial [Stellaceae bacterium]|nr:hypothetical protein [Stellaceae bacterium]
MNIPVQAAGPDAAGRFCHRVVIAAPPGRQLATMRAWLDENFGTAAWASAPAGFAGVVNDAVTFYFADPADARAFVNRFGCGYRAAAF